MLIDQVSKQQSTTEEVVSRVTSLEGVSKKQQMLLKHFTSKVYKAKEETGDTFNGSDIKSILRAQKSSKKSKRTVVGGAEKLVSSKSSKKMAAEKVHKKKKPKKEKVAKESPRKRKKDKQARISSPPSSNLVVVKDETTVDKPSTITPVKTSKTSGTKKPKTPTTPGEKPSGANAQPPITPGAIPHTTPGKHKAPTATPVRAHANALPSYEIDRTNLISVDEVLHKYQKSVFAGKMRVLAHKLAKEAVIGASVMKRCTPRGVSHYPALPTDSMYSIKQILLTTFTQYWDKPAAFESEWLKCVEAIERVCCDLRKIDSGFRRNPAPPMKPIPPDLVASGVAPAVSSVVGIRKPLPSSEIDKSELVSVQKFMSLNSTAISQGKFNLSQLTCKLATECILGRKLMAKCTPYGHSIYPGFPVAEFNLLKQLVLDCNPSLWNMMDEFERKWNKVCRRSLVKLCSNLRPQKESEDTTSSECVVVPQ